MKSIAPLRARELLAYDRQTGTLRWRQDRRSGFAGKINVYAGDEAGFIGAKGYRIVRADGKNYRAHRLIWLIETGSWPENEIDHINGDRADNRWANIRPATRAQNSKNQGIPANNKSGIKGVSWNPAKSAWQANIMADGIAHFLGTFSTKELAAKAYECAAAELHGEFRRAA